MKYRIRHVTTYEYDDKVDLARHLLHITPRALPWQAVIAASLAYAPTPGRVSTRTDHFGNQVTLVFLDLPHDRFEVTVEARVDVEFPAPPRGHAAVGSRRRPPRWTRRLAGGRVILGGSKHSVAVGVDLAPVTANE